ncbi:MAG: ATP-binding protein, partial [Chloroflexota bacterium]
GIGLPPGEAAQVALFDAFTRGANAPPERFTGFGLGLYICAEIVRRHGGAVWAESAGPGRGATFHSLLPPSVPVQPEELGTSST